MLNIEMTLCHACHGHTVAIIRFKHEKNLVLKGKQNVKYKSNCNKPFIVEIQFSTKAERKFKI